MYPQLTNGGIVIIHQVLLSCRQIIVMLDNAESR